MAATFDLMDFDLSDVEFMHVGMKSPVSLDLSFHPFPRLPYELRLEIIEEWCRSQGDTYWTPGDLTLSTLYLSVPYRRTSRRRNPLAEYATINRQWKSVVEKCTFRSLSFAIPDFGRDDSLDDREHSYRSTYSRAFDAPNALDDFERICVEDRIKAVSKIQIAISFHDVGGERTGSSVDTGFSAAVYGDIPHPDDNTNHSVAQTKHLARAAFDKVLRVLERFQESKLRSLHLRSGPQGLRMADTGLPTHSSLHLGQLLFAMTCRLEELTLKHVVDVPWFLKESWAATGNTPQSPPAWPNMRKLVIAECPSVETWNYHRTAADLHDSVTQALPQLPNLTMLDVSTQIQVCVDDKGRPHWKTAMVFIDIVPGDGHLGMREGHVFLQGPEPDPETMKLWKQIAQQQWDCNLEAHIIGITASSYLESS